MKRTLIILLVSILISSCNNPNSEVKKTAIKQANGFELSGNLELFFSNKAFLNKIIEDTMYQIDSSTIINNKFSFKGVVEYPERFALTFENYSAIYVLIIENKNFQIEIKESQDNEPIIKGSNLNDKLLEYKTASKNIFKKIDYLFPQFQKARLENDSEKLNSIGIDMKNIELEFTNYSFDFIKENSDSFVAGMVLRDQLKSSEVDTTRIKQSYFLLSESVKKSPDGELIAFTFNLH